MSSKMRHTAFLLIGEELSKIAPRLKQYIMMYGNSNAIGYLQVFTCCQKEGVYHLTGYVKDLPEKETVFSSGLNNRYRVKKDYQEELTTAEEVRQYFLDLFNRTVTIANPGENGTLNVCVCLPLYSRENWETAQFIVQEIIKTGRQYNVDVIGLPVSMSMLISDDEETRFKLPEMKSRLMEVTKEVAKEIVADSHIHRLLIFDDSNTKGLALNLDVEGLKRILGEYALLAVEHYPCIFPVTQMGSKIDVTTFGLSMLAFDKIYFIDYLLHKAYLEILGQENVTQKSVNVNMAAKWAVAQLEKHVNLYSDFMNGRVEPLIHERQSTGGLTDSDIQTLEDELQKRLDKAVTEMQSFIKDTSLSLPEKQAIMALLLGEDDSLLVGELYQKDQLTLDDCDKETLELYIAEDNKQVQVIEATETTPRKVIRGELSTPIDQYEHVYLPIEAIKLLRAQIRQRTSYIRKKTEELNAIQVQQNDIAESKKRIGDEGFTFDGTVYKLIPQDKEIRLFEKDYEPKPTSERSVDLRGYFTAVKNQGKLGACSAFALVSIFEQIMKKANPSNPDLSERFAYYNALKLSGGVEEVTEDSGSTFFDVVSSLTTDGLCSEEICPYNETIEKPSEEAYKDGKSRLVKEAKNVEISHEALTSALAEGYPVAISLKIYDTFNPSKNGFVFRPTDDEIEGDESGNHAMVLCGYSEEDKVYIVRNSWGTKFGDKGYCYVPFSYIEDPRLNNQACIITDVEVTETVKIEGVRKKKTVSFNMTDDSIRASILKILIGEEEILLGKDNLAYADLRRSYERLLQTLANPSKRDLIYQNSVKRLNEQLSAAQNEYDEFVRKSRPESIKEQKQETIHILIYLVGVFLFAGLMSGLLLYYGLMKAGLVFVTIAAIVLILTVLFFWYRKHKLSMLKKDLEEMSSDKNRVIAKLKQEKNEKHLRMHLAGRVISSLTDIKTKLINKYQSLTVYVSGLDKWCEDEKSKLTAMMPPSKTPCIQMLNNETLDKYFAENKELITNGIHLCDLADTYKLSDEDILNFKLQIRDGLIEKLEEQFKDFSVFSYLSKGRRFDFLPEPSEVSELMSIIDKRSDCFLQIEQTGVAMDDSLEKSLFVNTETQADRNQWRTLYAKHFSYQPQDMELNSKFKLIELQIQNLSLSQVALLK